MLGRRRAVWIPAQQTAAGREDVEATNFPEAALPVLYRQEVAEALAATEASKTTEENTDV